MTALRDPCVVMQHATILALNRYSRYCAWRGVVRDSEAPDEAAAARAAYPELGSALYFELSDARTHAVLYELPGQRLNWLWCAQPLGALFGNLDSACQSGFCSVPWVVAWKRRPCNHVRLLQNTVRCARSLCTACRQRTSREVLLKLP